MFFSFGLLVSSDVGCHDGQLLKVEYIVEETVVLFVSVVRLSYLRCLTPSLDRYDFGKASEYS